MMKKTFARMICLLLVTVMAFSLVGCKNKAGTSSDYDDDVVYDDIPYADADDGSAENGSAAENADGKDSNQGQSGKSQGKKDSGKNQSGSNKVVYEPTKTVNGSLSWDQLLAQMPKELVGTTINIYSWNEIKDVTGAEKVIDNFEALTGIKVKWSSGSYDEYTTNIAAQINAGNSPDLIRFRERDIDRLYLCQDIEKATGFDFTGDVWDSTVTSYYTIKGKKYAVNMSNTLLQQPYVLVYNKSVIDRLKYDDPYTLWKNGKWNWDTFMNMCKDFLEDTGNEPWCSYNHMDYYDWSGKKIVKFDGKKLTNNLKDKDILLSLQKMCDIRCSDFTTSGFRERDYITSGRQLFLTNSMIGLRRSHFFFKELKAENTLMCVPTPKLPGKDYYVSYSELEAYGVPKGAKNPVAAAYFLRYYLDATNYDEKMFFSNSQILDVYKTLRKEKNFSSSDDSYYFQNDFLGLTAFIKNKGSAAQVSTQVDKIYPQLDLVIKKYNDLLAKFD